MNRDTIPGTNLHARAEVTQPPSLKAARSQTRRRLHEPRPAATPEIRARVGQWKAEVKAACLAGYIGQSYDKYLHELLAIPSVARGDYCLYSDKEMALRLNLRGDGTRTVRRHRRAAAKHGLIEVLGHGRDHKPCMVRPVLRDGSPVFLDSKLAGASDTYALLSRTTLSAVSRTTLSADTLLTDTLKTESPSSPPVPVPNDTTRGGEALDQIEDQPVEPEPAKPVDPVEPEMTFPEFYLAMGRAGKENYARSEWRKLSAVDKAAIRDRLRRPHSWAAGMYAGNWLRDRVWEEAVPAPTARPERVWLHESTAEWRCWQRHLEVTKGRGTPKDSRGGWHFPSRLPPLLPDSLKRGPAMGEHAENAS
jgi:hypothetical protein